MEIARESIFVGSIRTFCRAFAAVVGIFLAFGIISFFYSALFGSHGFEEQTELTFLPDLNGNRTPLTTAAPAILKVDITGVIGTPEGIDSKTMENILLDSQTGILPKGRVKGILLRINSPGGTVVDSDNIYRMIKNFKEKHQMPVFAYVDGLCASGGMYIASSADRIFASPASTIGSIGVVIGPFFNLNEAMGKIGVQSQTLTQGLDKDMMNPFRPWKEGEDASLKNLIAYFYDQFVDIVTSNRPHVDRERLIQEYGAQIFNSVKAAEIGYIDVPNSSYEAALAALLQEAHIDPSKPYQVVELKPRHDFLSMLAKGECSLLNKKIEHRIRFDGRKSDALDGQMGYLYEPMNHL